MSKLTFIRATIFALVLLTSGSEWLFAACTTDAECADIRVSFDREEYK